MSEKRDAYVQKMKAKIDEWNAEFDKLEDKADGKYRNEKMTERSRMLFRRDSGAEYRFSEVGNGS